MLKLTSRTTDSLSLSWVKPEGFDPKMISDYHVKVEFMFSFDKRVSLNIFPDGTGYFAYLR